MTCPTCGRPRWADDPSPCTATDHRVVMVSNDRVAWKPLPEGQPAKRYRYERAVYLER